MARSQVLLLLALAALASAGRSKRQVPATCNLGAEPGPCRGRIIAYFYNGESGRCEQFTYGGCRGNANRFSSERTCVWACERLGDPPAQQRSVLFADASFCDRTCPLGCRCSGETVKCSPSLEAVPQGISNCASTIDLSNTGIRIVHNDAFQGLSRVTTLDLSGNRLRTVPVNAFRGLTGLQVLRLNNNQLLQLPANILQSLPSLREVHLQNNQLPFMACETIDNLPDLTLVNVSNNQLIRLIPHPGTPLDQMTIDLSGNRLPTFSVPLSPGSDGPTLMLQDNPWVCDCKLEQLITHYSSRPERVLDRNSALCTKPTAHARLPILLTEVENLECLPEDDGASSDICMKAPDAGPCEASMSRYYYNPASGTCQRFTYGGCMGNENNFGSLEACEKHCISGAGRPRGPVEEDLQTPAPTRTCGANAEYKSCVKPCQDTCEEPERFCFDVCIEGCFCREGYLRLGENGPCISATDERCLGPKPPPGPTQLTAPRWPQPTVNRAGTDRVELNLPRVPGVPSTSTFEIERRAPGGGWVKVPDTPRVTDRTQLVTGLRPGSEQEYRIRYYHPTRRQFSPWSNLALARTQPTSGPQPTQIAPLPKPAWDRDADIPSDNGVELFVPRYPVPNARYVVEYIDPRTGRTVRAGEIPADARDPFQVTGLQPNTPYRFYLTAEVDGRSSPQSDPLSSRTSQSAPATPAPLPKPVWDRNADTPSQGEVELSIPRYPVPNARYVLRYIDPVTGRPQSAIVPASEDRDSTYTVRGLRPDTPYRFSLTAQVDSRSSPQSDPLRTRTLQTPTEAPLPKPVWESPGYTSTTGDISLDFPSYPVPGSRYTVYVEGDNEPRRPLGSATPNSRMNVPGLRPNREYRFFIVAQNSGRSSPESDPLAARTKPITDPTDPPQPTEAPRTRYELTWEFSRSLEPLIRAFKIQYREVLDDGTFGEWVIADENVPKNARQYDLRLPRDGLFDILVDAGAPINEVFRETVEWDGPFVSPGDRTPSPPVVPRAPVWPTSGPLNTSPTSITVRLPTADPSTVFEVIDQSTGRVLGTYPANAPRVQNIPAQPNRVYRLGIRSRNPNTGRRSPVISEIPARTPPRPIAMPTTQPPPTPPTVSPVFPTTAVFPSNPIADLTDEQVTVNLPALHPSFSVDVFEIVNRAYQRITTTPGTGSLLPITLDRRPGFPTRVVFRIVDPQGGRSTGLSSPLDIPADTTMTTTPATEEPTLPSSPTIFVWPERNPVQVQPNSVTLRLPGSERPVNYELFNVLPNGQFQRLPTVPSRPTSQVTTIPVVPGRTYKFRVRSVDRGPPGLSGPLGRELEVRIPVPGDDVASSAPPPRALGRDGVITFPSPISGQLQWVIKSNITGVITRLAPTTRSYTLRTDRLSVGTHLITAETETGRILLQFIVIIRPAAAPAEGGTFSTTDMTARWTVDAASSSAKVTLCTSLEDHWMGFGISNDRLMANSDIITAFMSSSTNQPVVQDRYATSQSKPPVDSDSQVSDVEVSQENGRTCISFNIPCNSPDTKDVSLQGTRNYLFALGPVQNNDISYHIRGRWLSSGTIRCGQ